MKRTKYFLIIALLFITLVESIFAGPTIIRDNRIYDLAMTPVLGRGYSIATNTFQSTCMKDIKITEPSYDFKYTFESTEDLKATKQTTTVGGNVDLGHLLLSVKARTMSTDSQGKETFFHNIMVNINMDTYYASVDESKTSLGDAPKTLLLNNDIPGFFHSCGSYYARSIGRNARFVSVFTYSHDKTTRDKEFEIALKGFAGTITKLLGGPESKTSVGSVFSQKFSQLAEKKNLIITTQAWGLGKSQNAALVSYDLPTFKAAIKDAFISMQNPMTGRVTTMEVIPWVENAEFQTFIKLEEDTKNEKGEKMLLFEKKHILNLNSEFLARIERTDRKMMDIYYKAIICKQIIDSRWKRGGVFLPGLQEAEIRNNRNENVIKVGRLDSELSQGKIDDLLRQEEDFMYGKDGGAECMKQIMKEGIFRMSWRDILVCKNLRTKFATTMNEIIDDYCMPSLSIPK
jgi:hypothetical protein